MYSLSRLDRWSSPRGLDSGRSPRISSIPSEPNVSRRTHAVCGARDCIDRVGVGRIIRDGSRRPDRYLAYIHGPRSSHRDGWRNLRGHATLPPAVVCRAWRECLWPCVAWPGACMLHGGVDVVRRHGDRRADLPGVRCHFRDGYPRRRPRGYSERPIAAARTAGDKRDKNSLLMVSGAVEKIVSTYGT
jgi:hypothetical protein